MRGLVFVAGLLLAAFGLTFSATSIIIVAGLTLGVSICMGRK